MFEKQCFSCSGKITQKIFTEGSERLGGNAYMSQSSSLKTLTGKFHRHDILKLKEILKLFNLVLLGEDAEPREMASLLKLNCKP